MYVYLFQTNEVRNKVCEREYTGGSRSGTLEKSKTACFKQGMQDVHLLILFSQLLDFAMNFALLKAYFAHELQ